MAAWIIPALEVAATVFGISEASKASKRQAAAAESAANTSSTTEEIKHLSPVETQAMGMQGYIGARSWKESQQTIQQDDMYRMAQGNHGANFLRSGQAALNSAEAYHVSAYTRESEYAAYDFLRKSRTSMLSQIDLLGIDDGSGKNPYGVKITYDEYEELMRAKDPSQHIANGTSVSDPVTDDDIFAAIRILRPEPGYKAPAAPGQAAPGGSAIRGIMDSTPGGKVINKVLDKVPVVKDIRKAFGF